MFDFRTEIRNPKTGAIIERNPYRMRINKHGKTFERPVDSGNLWYEDGSAAGTIEMVEGKEKMTLNGEHKAYIKPLSKEQTVMNALSDKDSTIAKLEQDLKALELKAINAEREARIEEAPKQKPVIKKG